MRENRQSINVAKEEFSSKEDLMTQRDTAIRENEKLIKINQVLMRRVELGWGNHSDAYQSFENAALLADRVRERTLKLNQTLGRLQAANLEISKAQEESEQSRQRLADAVESIFDALVLFDDRRQMVLANSRFYELWSHTDARFELGKTSLSDIVNYTFSKGVFKAEVGYDGKAMWADHSFGNGVFLLPDNRWIQTSERHTADGGLVLIFTDITALKNSEAVEREKALEEQARVLESTINNMSQGVALVDADCELLVWNQRFLEISKLPAESVKSGIDFNQLMLASEVYAGAELLPINAPQGRQQSMLEHEKTLDNGDVIVIKRHLIPGGGFVNTYTDITDRSRQKEALIESEKRMRLITDTVPAGISYINSDLDYEFANLQFARWFDRSREQIEGKSMSVVMGDEMFAQHREYVNQALTGETVEFEIEDSSPSQKNLISQKIYVPHYGHDDEVVGFFALEQNVTQQRRTERALKSAYQNLEDRVYQRTRQITDINNQLRDEIRERRQIESRLIEAKSEAEEANISKIKFLAATSHDLLQPMNAASLFASALLEKNLPEDTRGLVQSLSYSLENIESLISALVDISKLDAGVVEAEMGSFNVSELLDNLAKEFNQQTDDTTLDMRYVASTLFVETDSQLLARILRNFLSNALRYTEQGKVLLGCRRRKTGLEIQVLDTGPGIAKSERREIFHEFQRGKSANINDDKGLGLGLAIVDKISRILDHPIDIKSIPGKGSCFSVLVPYAIQQPGIDNKNDAKENSAAVFQVMAPTHVIVIDNDESICEAMEILLSGWGCSVHSIHTNQQIDSLLTRGTDPEPDLIIADYHLGNDLTGLDVINQYNHGASVKVPILMITANYTSELRQQVRESGYHIINKPVKPLKLKLAMNHLLRRD
ncbi:MAG: PAS domain-containing protein [Gammaproteobacteria bacterium]|nr:PAS domain-containing protein [Gammaproteobacteria bacterium]